MCEVGCVRVLKVYPGKLLKTNGTKNVLMEDNMKKIYFLILFLLSQIIYADSKSIVIDLAKDEPNKDVITIRTHLEKIDSLEIRNWFSNADYKIEIVLESEIPPLKITGDMSAANPKIAKDKQTGGECKNLVELIGQIDKLQTEAEKSTNEMKWMESELSDLLEKLRLTLQTIEKNKINCASTALANEILVKSVYNNPINLEFGEDDQLIIVIKRAKLKWEYLITRHSRSRGKWYTSYGFSFISPVITKSDNFFVKKSDDNNSNGFIIAQKEDSGNDESEKNFLDMEFVPSIFFWWMPTKKMSNPWRVGFTGGLGIDFKNPVVFAGIGFIYNYNIGINLGVALHKQYLLKDKYHEGMLVNQILEFDDLHKGVYRPNLFLSITFRFGSNPFAPAKTNETTQDNKPKEDNKPKSGKK
jgi:hypothetical protein